MPNAEQLCYQTEKSSHQKFCIKMLFLKVLQYSWENNCEIFKNTYFEEYLHMAVSKLTLWSDCLEICVWITSKTILTQQYYNIQIFKQNLAHMLSIYLNQGLKKA